MLPRENPEETEFSAKVADREFEEGGGKGEKVGYKCSYSLVLSLI